MPLSSPELIQSTLREWLCVDDWNHAFALTLTLKQRIGGDGGISAAATSLTREIASQNLKHFLNVMNKQMYGSASQRHGKRLPVFSVLEGGNGKRLHYHLGCVDKGDSQEGEYLIQGGFWGGRLDPGFDE